jgi:hypothetical protein
MAADAGRPTNITALRPHQEGPMTNNVGMIDRAIRIIVGLLLIAFAIPIGFASTGWNWIGWIGVVPLVTGLFGTCPLYSLLGISTCPLRRTAQ